MNWLNDSGVTTNRNQKFTYNSVQTLLTNKRYIGCLLYTSQRFDHRICFSTTGT